MDICYTWYLNHCGDVQVYNGYVNDFVDVSSKEEAMKAHMQDTVELKKVPKGIMGVFNPEKYYEYDYIYKKEQVREPIKYFIPQEYAEAFFTLIGNPTRWIGASDITNIDISEFLDD